MQKQKILNNMFKKDNGITLIALIITIIIMLILAVVTINALSEGNIFNHANNAATLYVEEAEKENKIISQSLDRMDSIVASQANLPTPVVTPPEGEVVQLTFSVGNSENPLHRFTLNSKADELDAVLRRDPNTLGHIEEGNLVIDELELKNASLDSIKLNWKGKTTDNLKCVELTYQQKDSQIVEGYIYSTLGKENYTLNGTTVDIPSGKWFYYKKNNDNITEYREITALPTFQGFYIDSSLESKILKYNETYKGILVEK